MLWDITIYSSKVEEMNFQRDKVIQFFIKNYFFIAIVKARQTD